MDRNNIELASSRACILSLSARRAWIEIADELPSTVQALSLSARRAWIEIAVLELIPLTDPVALRKESVDRNTDFSGGAG